MHYQLWAQRLQLYESIRGKADFTWQQNFKKSLGIRSCRCNQYKTCIRLLERKIWRRNGTAWACMASKDTGSLNEVAADGKSSKSSEAYRAALSVRKILQNHQDDASFQKVTPEFPKVSKRSIGAMKQWSCQSKETHQSFSYESQN